ncbi:HAD family hydrolase [Polyangium mundeleinium]|uniref:HAD-IB family hydrolase n=1 Tax=Polyangium mundeleinium TaxID=2995306 RepID=A0ABT5EFT6_9BACT|nr:HAD family hydrolase [Polyangium mundeleinium]MDC0740088.1 HAD-IB family hydrolase [Polyangium mundeleinium]
MSAPKPRAALFDMDRTLVRKETASLYVRYLRDIGEASTFDLLKTFYWVGQYTLGLLDAEGMAEKALAPLSGTPESTLVTRCEDWFGKYVERHVADAGRRAVKRHKAAGDVCAIVTGATKYAARPLAQRLEIEHVVGTELEIDARGLFTGRAERPLCLGVGKVRRAEALAERLGFVLEESTFYSDSVTDVPLLERVAEPIAVNPDPRLERLARQRGWRIERW